MDSRRSAVTVTGPTYLRARKELRKGARVTVDAPRDNSPRSFLHRQPRIKHLLAVRIARVPHRGQPSVLRRVPPAPFCHRGTEIVSRLTEHQPEGT